MLFGYYEHTLDSKGRLVVPSKLRGELGNTMYILRGLDGCLSIYKDSAFLEMMKSLQSLHFTESDPRQFIRTSLYSACELELDKAGRVQIPAHLLAKHNIGKDVVVTGVGDHIEVWDKDRFHEYEEKANANFDSIAENLFKDKQ